jgi:predicted CXXCH cytochrome family protein
MYTDPALTKAWNESGTQFRPGDALEKTRQVVSPSQLSADELQSMKIEHAEFWESRFWPDGMVRTLGRDYNGLLESACYQQGGMTCLSCHSIHHSDPNDQLAKGMQTNEACYQCHDSYRDSLTAHTHHTADSSGSLCYNCHMPHTSYGLFKAVRSHQISSPSVATTIETGRPSACGLCHLDRPSSWIAARLTQWYDRRPVELNEDQKTISEAALFLLRGDAAQRAIVAWAFGWPEAKEAAGDDWMPPFLAPLLDDPYSAVRLIAERSLRRLGYDLEYDFVGPSQERTLAREAVMDRWRELLAAKEGASIDPAATLDQMVIQRLLSDRDDRPITIAE